MARHPIPAIERFLKNVDRVSHPECWLWTGAVNQFGYGVFSVTRGDSPPAHRFAYRHYKGPIPERHQVHHLCGRRDCVRPEHLMVMTPSAHRLHHEAATAPRLGSRVLRQLARLGQCNPALRTHTEAIIGHYGGSPAK